MTDDTQSIGDNAELEDITEMPIDIKLRINKNKTDDFKLTFAEIENIAGVPIDHSFLTFKKELLQYGFKVVKISMKEQTVDFEKVEEEA